MSITLILLMRKLRYKRLSSSPTVTLLVSGRARVVQIRLSLLVTHWVLRGKWLGLRWLWKPHLPVLRNSSISGRIKDGIWVSKSLIVSSECGRSFSALLFFKDFICLFLERGERREKERERNINVWLPLVHPPLGTWPATQACALSGNQTGGDPWVLRMALNALSHTSQGSALFF